MPIDPNVVAGIAQAGTGGLNAFGTGITNRRNRKHDKHMYNVQRDDNIAFWNMQNDYNSPESQMQRFKDAGLNPNLIYGSGTAGAAGNAGNIATPDAQRTPHRDPQLGQITQGATNAINEIYDLEIKQATADNLKAQNTVILGEAALKAAQTNAVSIGADRGAFDLKFEQDMMEISADARREKVRQMKTQSDYTLSENERKTAMHSYNLQEAATRIAQMKLRMENTKVEKSKIYSQIENIKKDSTLKQLDIELARLGVSRNSPMYAKILARVLSNYFDPVTGKAKPKTEKVIEKGLGGFKKWGFLFK